MPPAGGRESERASERERDGFETRLAHVEQHLAAAANATSRAGSKASSKASEVVKLVVKLRGGILRAAAANAAAGMRGLRCSVNALLRLY